jgi:hypothetical protein
MLMDRKATNFAAGEASRMVRSRSENLEFRLQAGGEFGRVAEHEHRKNCANENGGICGGIEENDFEKELVLGGF